MNEIIQEQTEPVEAKAVHYFYKDGKLAAVHEGTTSTIPAKFKDDKIYTKRMTPPAPEEIQEDKEPLTVKLQREIDEIKTFIGM